MRILVTGGTGFLGKALVTHLAEQGKTVRVACRQSGSEKTSAGAEYVPVGDIGPITPWSETLADVDMVVHLAARAHVLRESHPNPEQAFLATNYEGTKRLADACCGRVKRFVYLSSIGVHGSANTDGAFSESSAIQPTAAYARTKARAESYLQTLTSQGDLGCTILRPPLVYGANAPGNLARLVNLVRRGVPLPLAAVDNRRNLIDVDHLVRAIVALLDAQTVSKPAYVIADREAVSTADMIRAIAAGLDRSPRLWPLSPKLLRGMGAITGRRSTVEQLVGNLEVDAANFRDEFGDLQSCSTQQGLTDMTRATCGAGAGAGALAGSSK